MYKKIFLITLTAASLMQASNNNTAASSSTTGADSKPSAWKIQKFGVKRNASGENTDVATINKLPLDFTPLPYEMQDIILGYVGSGWQQSGEKVQLSLNKLFIADLYYYHDALLVAVSDRIKPVFFDKNVDPQFILDLEKSLTDAQTWHQEIQSWMNGTGIYTISPGRIHKENGEKVRYSKNYRAAGLIRTVHFKKLQENAPDIVTSVTAEVEGEDNTNLPFATGGWANVIVGMCFTSDEQLFAVVKGNRIIYLFNLSTGKLMKTLKVDSHVNGALAISPDGNYLASGGGALSLWDINSGKQLVKYSLPRSIAHFNHVEIDAVTFSPDSKSLVLANGNGRVDKWEFQPDLNDLK